MKESNVSLVRIKEGTFNIYDMKDMFGDRIKRAIMESDEHGSYLDTVEMQKLIKKWKIWNRDILLAYKHYYGFIRIT